jgi:RND family efflux transporter MFP subunit
MASNSGHNGRMILYYVDPMHPSYKSDKPGIAPDCGMKLEPVYADGGGPDAGGSGEPSSTAPGTVKISPDRQQLIGVKVGTVEKKSVSQTIRITGRVAVDETRVYRINATNDGWIQDVFPVTVGSFVTKNQPLASFYSPEFLSAEQAYFYALNALDRFIQQESTNQAQINLTKANIQQQRDVLKNLGMGDHQIDELAKTREFVKKILISAPVTGFVLARNITPGERYERGKELFKFADMSNVWILADIFENEAQFLQSGVVARVILPHQNKTFRAKVSNTLPQFDPVSRTLKVRLEADNPDFVLKPDMFVDVELPINFQPTIAVPVDAVVDTGLRKIVFVDKGNGIFEPRRIQTGWRRGGLIEITRGLMNKERIVVAGTFMIDSESRMQAAAMGIYDEGIMDPVCGMFIDEKKAKASGRTIKFGGVSYFFCSPECMRDFEKSPRRYEEGAVGELRKETSAHMTAPTDTHDHHD